jgi:DNA polymerase III subunit gamma/tau
MSENFHVTARKWRPMRFDEVVGQDHVTRTLKNAIREGRMAHAYLFTGQRGCGKTTVARILAKAINCPNAKESGYEPCNQCDICKEITEGRSMDVSEIDGASNNGVDDVRSLRDNVKYPPLHGEYKVVIIDEVHMLSTSAFNALLKTLEEPPRHLIFVFATTEVQKVLPTILSRTQRYDFRRMQLDEIIERLRLISSKEGITIDDEALLVVAKKADGSMRDAQSIFDQVVAFTGKEVDTNRVREALNLIDTDFFFEVTDAILERSGSKAFELSQSISSRGYDIEEFFIGLLEHFRNLLTARLTQSSKLIEVSKVHQERYINVATELSEGDILRLIRLGQHALESLKTSQQPRIVLEVSLVEMMLMERAVELNQLLSEIRSTKQGLSIPRESSSPAAERPSAPSTPRPSSAVINRAAEAPRERSKETAVKPPSLVKAVDEVAFAANEGATLNPDEALAKWSDFRAFIKTKSRFIDIVMDDVQLCGIRRHALYFGVEAKETLDVLKQYQTQFSGYLREFFGRPQLSFEAGPRNEMVAKADVPIVSPVAEYTLASTNGEMPPSDVTNAPSTGSLRSRGELTDTEKLVMERFKAHPVD